MLKTVKEIRAAILGGTSTAEEIIKDCLQKIHVEDEKIGAFLETFDDEALARAKEIDALSKEEKEALPLCGVPVAIKDLICYAGHTVSAGSKILQEYKATYTATALQRLLDAGAIVIGRTNMDEFAFGSSTESSAFQLTRNPRDLSKVPGGSSGGSAAAVAAGFVPVALGSETGGSIRQPAALCGIVGIKPSYGRVSRYGLLADVSSFDQIGPFANTVEDATLVLQLMEGKDEKDATSLQTEETTVPELLSPSFQGVRVGVPKEYFIEGMDADVARVIREGIDRMKAAGAEIVELSLPLAPYALPTYYIIQPAEASSNLERYEGIRYGLRAEAKNLNETYLQARGEGFGLEVKRRIMLGTFILSAGYYDAYYKKALAVKAAITHEIQDAFKHVDVIVSPVSPIVAWDIGKNFEDPLAMYLMDIFTVTANLAGICGISVPCGTSQNLPVGIQFLGPQAGESKMLHAAAAFETLTK